MDPVLSSEERRIVHAQRDLRAQVRALLEELEMLPADARALDGIRTALDEMFLLVVVGEYNAGKSTLINTLLGQEFLESGDLPTTREVHLLKHGDVSRSNIVEPGLMEHHLPAELLRDVCIVDTPGTNSMQRREQELTEGFVPRADLVLFLTTLVRPYTASEHEFLKVIREWGKKILFAVNHADVARDAEQIERVRDYVLEQAGQELEDAPPIFVISARGAWESRQAAGPADPAAGFEYAALEAHLKKTLAHRDRVERKLRSPLESLGTVLARFRDALSERIRLVEGDRVAMDDILTGVDEYETRMLGELGRYQAKVDNILLQMEKRGHRFLDDLVRLGNLLRLRDSDVVENRFRTQVVADTAERIEAEGNALIDWLVRENLGAWDRANALVEERRAALHESAEKTRFVPKSYVYNREEIFSSLAVPVRRHLEAFDAREEANRVVSAVNHAIARTFGTEALVVGLGAVLTAAFTSLTIDVTGTVGGTILVVAGLMLLPHRRKRLQRELATKIETLREELKRSLEECFHDEVRAYSTRLRDVFRPERDAAKARVDGLREAEGRLVALGKEREDLTARIGARGDGAPA
jgi:GTP-binding protein EngB required for normal cell division